LAAIGAAVALGVAAAPASADPPPAPTNVAMSPGDGATTANAAVATWTVPDGLPADTDAVWSLTFSPAGEDYFLPLSGTSDENGRADIPLLRDGVYSSLRVALVSDQGEQGPETTIANRLVVDRSAPGAPTIRRQGDLVRWTNDGDTGASIVRAHWRYCRNWTGLPTAPAPVCAEGVATTNPFALSETAAPLGPAPGACLGVQESLTMWLEDAAGNGSAANTGTYGSAVSPACAAPPTGAPTPPSGGPPVRKATTLMVKGRALASRRGARNRRVRIVTTLPGDAAGRVALRVTRRGSGPRFVRTRSVQVRRGRAVTTFTVPAGVRRLNVRATYAATATHAAASKNTIVRVGR
jgi:hypothetical protein